MIRTQPINVMASLRRLMVQHTTGARLDAEQARNFAALNGRQRLNHILLTALMALVLFNLFLVSDRYMVPDVFEFAVAVRLYVLTPFVLTLVLIGCLYREWWVNSMPPWFTDFVAMIGTMAVAASLGAVMLASHSDQLPIYRGGLVPVMVFGNLVQRLRFRFAVCSSLFILGVYVFTLWAHSDRPAVYQVIEIPQGLLLLLVAIYTLVSNFNLELDERHSFLQKERAKALRDQLEQSNQNLENMSRRDPLTGLANRRQFDAYVAARLNDGGVGRRLAVMLIDVDHFKAFNDRYGHPAGDRCLRLVAGALNAAMGAHEGLVARWGGEEFAVVLPDGEVDICLKLADAMRAGVDGLAMRHEVSTCSDHVTVSIGVAVAWVYAAPQAVYGLLNKADQALYRAKAEGRNRSVLASGALN